MGKFGRFFECPLIYDYVLYYQNCSKFIVRLFFYIKHERSGLFILIFNTVEWFSLLFHIFDEKRKQYRKNKEKQKNIITIKI